MYVHKVHKHNTYSYIISLMTSTFLHKSFLAPFRTRKKNSIFIFISVLNSKIKAIWIVSANYCIQFNIMTFRFHFLFLQSFLLFSHFLKKNLKFCFDIFSASLKVFLFAVKYYVMNYFWMVNVNYARFWIFSTLQSTQNLSFQRKKIYFLKFKTQAGFVSIKN